MSKLWEQLKMEAKYQADYTVAMDRAEILDEEARIRREQKQAENERMAFEEARARRIRRRYNA